MENDATTSAPLTDVELAALCGVGTVLIRLDEEPLGHREN